MRWTKRRRTRSKSPTEASSSVKKELKTEDDSYYNNYDDDWVEEHVDLGYGVTSRDLVGLSREEKIAVFTLGATTVVMKTRATGLWAQQLL